MTEFPGSPADRETTITTYLRYAAGGSADQEDFWAWEAVSDYTHSQPALACWNFVLELLHRASEDALGLVVAGPLEDVVSQHGSVLVDLIEREADRDELVRWALGGIWLCEDELPPAVLERVVRASGGEITLFPPLKDLA